MSFLVEFWGFLWPDPILSMIKAFSLDNALIRKLETGENVNIGSSCKIFFVHTLIIVRVHLPLILTII